MDISYTRASYRLTSDENKSLVVIYSENTAFQT